MRNLRLSSASRGPRLVLNVHQGGLTCRHLAHLQAQFGITSTVQGR